MRKNDLVQMKKLLIVAYVFPPIAYAGTFRTLRICNHLARKGYEISVLTIKVQNDLSNDFSLLKSIDKEVKIYRTVTFDPWRWYQKYKPRLLKRRLGRYINKLVSIFIIFVSQPDHMVFWVPIAVIKALDIMKKQRIDLVYTTSPPHSEQMVGYLLKKITKVKWIADLRDPIMDNISTNSLALLEKKFHFKLENLVSTNADRIVVNTGIAKKKLERRYIHPRIISIRNSFDEEDFVNIERHKFECFTVSHVGSLYGFRKIDPVIAAIKKLKLDQIIEPGKFKLLLVGSNDDSINQKVVNAGNEDFIENRDLVPHEEAIRIMVRSHLLLLIKGFGRNSDSQIPGKLFEYIGSGSKILCIAPSDCEAAMIVVIEKAGYVVENKVEPIYKILKTEYEGFLKGYCLNNNSGNSRRKYGSVYMAEQMISVLESIERPEKD